MDVSVVNIVLVVSSVIRINKVSVKELLIVVMVRSELVRVVVIKVLVKKVLVSVSDSILFLVWDIVIVEPRKSVVVVVVTVNKNACIDEDIVEVKVVEVLVVVKKVDLVVDLLVETVVGLRHR